MSFEPGSAASVSSTVELGISCNGLHDADVFSKSDPMVVMYVNNLGGWVEHGRTEIIWDNLNPEFANKFVIDYHFETQQKLKFEVHDIGTGKRFFCRLRFHTLTLKDFSLVLEQSHTAVFVFLPASKTQNRVNSPTTTSLASAK